MKYLYAFLLLFLVSCASDEVQSDEPLRGHEIVNVNSHKSTLITVYAENSLSEEKKLALAHSFNKWSIKTDARVRFDVIFVPREALLNNPYIEHTFYYFDRAPSDPKFTGYCNWVVGKGAVIEIKPEVEVNWFVSVALHEIGHALNLAHYSGEYESIMEEALRNGTDISCYDLKTFCKEWECEIDCELKTLVAPINTTGLKL